jgi:hypothetical protein
MSCMRSWLCRLVGVKNAAVVTGLAGFVVREREVPVR